MPRYVQPRDPYGRRPIGSPVPRPNRWPGYMVRSARRGDAMSDDKLMSEMFPLVEIEVVERATKQGHWQSIPPYGLVNREGYRLDIGPMHARVYRTTGTANWFDFKVTHNSQDVAHGTVGKSAHHGTEGNLKLDIVLSMVATILVEYAKDKLAA